MTAQMLVLLTAFVAAVLLLALPMGRWLAWVANTDVEAASTFRRIPSAVL